jgi:hypothetical protein
LLFLLLVIDYNCIFSAANSMPSAVFKAPPASTTTIVSDSATDNHLDVAPPSYSATVVNENQPHNADTQRVAKDDSGDEKKN